MCLIAILFLTRPELPHHSAGIRGKPHGRVTGPRFCSLDLKAMYATLRLAHETKKTDFKYCLAVCFATCSVSICYLNHRQHFPITVFVLKFKVFKHSKYQQNFYSQFTILGFCNVSTVCIFTTHMLLQPKNFTSYWLISDGRGSRWLTAQVVLIRSGGCFT